MKNHQTKMLTELPSKTFRRRFPLQILIALPALAVALCILGYSLFAQIPAPVLTIVPTNGDQFYISITNAVASTNYEIYRTPLLMNSNFPWTLHIVGAVGQSNFIVDTEAEDTGFFRAAIGSDWDLDGVPNSQDADPTDPTLGILTITIDSPSNGSTIN